MQAKTISLKQWRPQAVFLGVLFLILCPGPLEAVAARIGFEMHVVSFLIGPALYAFGDNLVPGIDYFTQYSVGQPYLFSFLLAPSAAGTMIRYAGWIIAAMFLFYAGMFYFLWWLYRNWRWAAAVTLLVLISSFHTERPFFDPSSYPLRYPLLFVWLTAIILLSRFPGAKRFNLAIALVNGFSLFLNTETGLYMLLATGLVVLATNKSPLYGVCRYSGILAGSAATFTLLCVGAFGPGIFDPIFFKRIIEPFFIYGEGFGAWPVFWDFGWHLLYNLVSPGVALATMGWAIVKLRSGDQFELRTRVVALLAASTVAIMMSVKYWNMSIAALWLVNSVLFWTVIAWWLIQALKLVEDATAQPGAGVAVNAQTIKWVLAIAALMFVTVLNDSRNRSFYGMRAYGKYQGLIKKVFWRHGDACMRMDCAVPSISKKDVDLITSMTGAGQRVAMFSPIDWAYLIEAKRAPHFEFVPSHATFTRRQLTTATTGFDLIFTPRSTEKNHGIEHPELAAILVPLLDREFAIAAEGEALVAWKRRSH